MFTKLELPAVSQSSSTGTLPFAPQHTLHPTYLCFTLVGATKHSNVDILYVRNIFQQLSDISDILCLRFAVVNDIFFVHLPNVNTLLQIELNNDTYRVFWMIYRYCVCILLYLTYIYQTSTLSNRMS